MKTVYTLMVVCLMAGLALAGCCGKSHKGHAAGDACCSTEKAQPK